MPINVYTYVHTYIDTVQMYMQIRKHLINYFHDAHRPYIRMRQMHTYSTYSTYSTYIQLYQSMKRYRTKQMLHHTYIHTVRIFALLMYVCIMYVCMYV